ncbi:betaine-aldehyde dehydrogenase [Sphingobium faniae]|nr:betaine-aldehyde dehydrogenase [Sphingobium faniae]
MSRYFSDPRAALRHPDMLYIDGRWVDPESGGGLSLISPSDEAVHSCVAEASVAEVDAAVRAARRAFDEGPWPLMSPAERASRLRAFAAALRQRADSFAALWSLQTGIPHGMARHALQNPGMIYDYYADLICETVLFESRQRDNGGYAIIAREPVGVVAAVTPWNHPSHLMALKAAPALAMGCTVIAKPPPEAPMDVFLLAEAAEEAGLPPGVFNIAPADRAGSDHLVRHPGVDKVSFTGSAATGAHISSVCGARMARSSMELGGKSAAIVLDDIDLARIAPLLVETGGKRMAGQGCAFLTRVLVSRKRHDALAAALAAAMATVKVGHAFHPETEMGPIAMKRQLDKVLSYIERGKAEGATLATGGGRPETLLGVEGGKGFYVAPTLFANVTNDMAIAREEIFGPVLSLIAYDDEEQAIRIANDNPYGLNGAVFTDDREKAFAIARRIRAGNFTQNGLEHDSKFPFGGYKMSGTGREGGSYGLDLYSEIKTIYMAQPPAGLA